MDTLWEVFSFLFLFILVLGLAYLTTRYLGGRLGATGGSGRLMRVVEVLSVGRDRQLLVVEVAGRFLLIGAGTQGFSLLTELSQPQDLARVAAVLSQSPPQAGLPAAVEPFRQVLARLMNRDTEPPAAGGVTAPGGEPGADAAPGQAPRDAAPGQAPRDAAADRLAANLERLRRLGSGREGSGQK